MKTTITDEEAKLLAPYEEYMRTAVNQRWSRYPGVKALEVMHSIAGEGTRLNANCQACVLALIQRCGVLYFAHKAQLPKVEVSPAPATKKRTTVKTKK